MRGTHQGQKREGRPERRNERASVERQNGRDGPKGEALGFTVSIEIRQSLGRVNVCEVLLVCLLAPQVVDRPLDEEVIRASGQQPL